MNRTAVEVTTQFATVADDLSAAWAFIMARVDRVGDAPQITISPMWWYGDNDEPTRKFEVSVSGMVPE